MMRKGFLIPFWTTGPQKAPSRLAPQVKVRGEARMVDAVAEAPRDFTFWVTVRTTNTFNEEEG